MIKFNQPRYILPLILLPFIYVFYYMYQYTKAESEEPTSYQETAAINAELPDPFLDEDNLKDKFDAFQEAHKYNRDFSAIQEIDNREDQSINKTEMLPKMHVNSLQQKPKSNIASVTNSYLRANSTSARKKELSDYEKQMRLFRAQMSYMDSLFREEANESVAVRSGQEAEGGSHVKGIGESSKVKAGEDVYGLSEKDDSKPLRVEKAKGIGSGEFNTVSSDEKDLFIKAIIDEELKVIKSSRVRIRLLEEVQIGDLLIPKGHYLFGLVSAFKPERIEITISSLLLHGEIMEISLDIYDLDGLKGLYVPESQFRELAKNMGSSMASGQQLNLDAPPDNQMQLMYGLAKDAFNTTTQAASKSFRKNKAKLKYNTMVYLVNSTSSKKTQTL